jgi:hypothetical protein
MVWGKPKLAFEKVAIGLTIGPEIATLREGFAYGWLNAGTKKLTGFPAASLRTVLD